MTCYIICRLQCIMEIQGPLFTQLLRIFKTMRSRVLRARCPFLSEGASLGLRLRTTFCRTFHPLSAYGDFIPRRSRVACLIGKFVERSSHVGPPLALSSVMWTALSALLLSILSCTEAATPRGLERSGTSSLGALLHPGMQTLQAPWKIRGM